jgi:hypothetical protein
MTGFGAVRFLTRSQKSATYAASAVIIAVSLLTRSRNLDQRNVKKRGQFNAGAEFDNF